jgi:Tol biopolymer transport system component
MKKHTRSMRLIAGAMALGLIITAQAQVTALASLAWNGAQGNGTSPGFGAAISGNGRYVAFLSLANNLVPGDTNGYGDVFVRDTWPGGTTVRVSVADGALGAQATGGESSNPSISPDGRFVSFSSLAYNLVGMGDQLADMNGAKDVFVRDTWNNTTTLVSVADGFGGVQGNFDSDSSAISADGNVVVFRSVSTNLVAGGTTGSQVFVRNIALGTTTLVSVAIGGGGGNGTSGFFQTAISPDGLVVGFSSTSTNLVASIDTNNASDVFVRNLAAGVTTRVSSTSGGSAGNAGSYSSALSSTGRYVAFCSDASNLISGDTGGQRDVFVRDTQTGITTRVSVSSASVAGNGFSGSTNNGWGSCGISADGRYVAFQSNANNLIGNNKDKNNAQDIFVRDRQLGLTTLRSGTSAGVPANGASSGPSISSDGLSVMFCSLATNLVASDTNGLMDVFRRG